MRWATTSRSGAHTTKRRDRIVQHLEPGSATAVPSNIKYRLGKLLDFGLLRGEWLDCGCADGGYTVALVDLGAESAVGIDTQEEQIVQARERERTHPTVRFLCASAESLPFPEAAFDNVLLNEVLEHVTDEAQTLREIYRVLRPEGHLIISSPNRWFPFEGHGMQIGQHKINIPIPLLPWIPKRIAQRFMRARNYWPRELRDLVCNEGFVIRSTGFIWPMFEVYPWLPSPVIPRYRDLVPVLERIPFIRRFGVSIFIVARKP